MFPGFTAAQLFEPCGAETSPASSPTHAEVDTERGLLDVIEDRLTKPAAGVVSWGPDQLNAPRLAEPDLATARAHGPGASAQDIMRRLMQFEGVARLDSREITQFAYLAGHIIDLDTRIDLHIGDDGSAHLTYRYETLNMTDKPLTRLPRELWFEHTDGRLDIRPLRDSTHRLAIQRVHDTPNLAKFACQLSPAIKPGESAQIGYSCDGGRFEDALYWRQAVYRYTRRLTINLRHANAGDVLSCSAVEEHPDGAENSATEHLTWDYEGEDVIVTLVREYLRPSQSVTLRWEVARENP